MNINKQTNQITKTMAKNHHQQQEQQRLFQRSGNLVAFKVCSL